MIDGLCNKIMINLQENDNWSSQWMNNNLKKEENVL